MRFGVFILYLFYLSNSVGKNVSNDYGCSHYNQGDLGNCHAYGLTCPIEHYETMKTNGKKPFRVSVTWLVFVSMVDRLCSDENLKVNPRHGWFGTRNFNRLLSMGYCSEKQFLSISTDEKQWLSSKEDLKIDGKKIEGNNSIEKLWNSIELSEKSHNEKLIGTIDPRLESVFKEQFGISSEDAKLIYCDPTNLNEKIEMAKERVDPKFYECAKQSLEKSIIFKKDCNMQELPLSEGTQDRFDALKRTFKQGNHVMLSMVPNLAWDGTSSSNHVVDAYGFNETPLWLKDEIKVQNSWDPNSKTSLIEKSRLNSLNDANVISCSSYQNNVDEKYLPPNFSYKVPSVLKALRKHNKETPLTD